MHDGGGIGHGHGELDGEQPHRHPIAGGQVTEHPLAGDVDPAGGEHALLTRRGREDAQDDGVGARVEPVERAARLGRLDDRLAHPSLLEASGHEVRDRAQLLVGGVQAGDPQERAAGRQHGGGQDRRLPDAEGALGCQLRDVAPDEGEGVAGGVDVVGAGDVHDEAVRVVADDIARARSHADGHQRPILRLVLRRLRPRGRDAGLV